MKQLNVNLNRSGKFLSVNCHVNDVASTLEARIVGGPGRADKVAIKLH